MIKWIVKYNGKYLKVNGGVRWIDNPRMANEYTSRYAAKRHIKDLELIEDCIVVDQRNERLM